MPQNQGFAIGGKPYVPHLVRGERFLLEPYQQELLCIDFQYTGNLEIDGYAFLLRADGKVRQDGDLVFFGQQQTADGSVANSGCQFFVKLFAAAPEVERIALVYAIYSEHLTCTLAELMRAELTVQQNGQKLCIFPLTNLPQVTAVVAAELYRHQGKWKLKAVGQGWQGNLKELCERFGVEVA